MTIDYRKQLIKKIRNSNLKGLSVPPMMFSKEPPLELKAKKKERRKRPVMKEKNCTFRINADLKDEYERVLKENYAHMTAHLTSEIQKYIEQHKKKKKPSH